MKHYVYIYTNKLNNKKYIGQTTKTLEERAGSNFVNYKESINFYNALLEFGNNNFNREIVFETKSLKKSNKKEKELIELYKTMDINFGYNIQPGSSDFVMNEEIKNKISIKVKNSKRFQINNFKSHAKKVVAISIKDRTFIVFNSLTDAANRLNISRGNIGTICNGTGRAISLKGYLFMFEKNFDKDKINELIEVFNKKQANRYSELRNEKMRKSLKEKYSKDKSSFKNIMKKVICIDTNEEFESITAAAKAKGIKIPQNIAYVCYDQRKTAGKLHWKFLNSTTIPDECKGVESKS